MRCAVAAAALALCGCDKLLSLGPITPPAPDAPYLVCTRQTSPTFVCGDFDEDPSGLYTNGQPVMLPPAGVGVTATRMMQGVSPPNALYIASTTGQYVVDLLAPGTATATRVSATLQLNLIHEPPYDFEVLQIGTTRNSSAECTAVLQVGAAPAGVRLEAWCGNNRYPGAGIPYVTSAIPVGFHAYTLTYDLAIHEVSLAYDSDAPVVVDFAVANPVATPANVRFGMLNVVGATFALDDLVVTAN